MILLINLMEFSTLEKVRHLTDCIAMKKAFVVLTLVSVWILVLLCPSPTKAVGSPYIIRGSANSTNIVASTVSEISSPTTSCSWVGSKGLTGGVNANYFKDDISPVGWAGFGAGTVKNYGAGRLPATRTFILRTSGSMTIVDSDSLTNGSDLALAVSGRELEFNAGPQNRTVLGLKDGELILFVLPYATPYELVAYAQTLGLNNGNAIQLDGGGSSTFCQGSTPLFGSTRQVPVSIGLKNGTITKPESNANVKIMALGDSITAGAGGTPYECFLRDSMPNAVFVGDRTYNCGGGIQHEGHGGYSTLNILNGYSGSEFDSKFIPLRDSISKHRPNIVLVHLGTNDVAGIDSVPTIVGHLQQIVNRIHEVDLNIQVYVAQIVPAVRNWANGSPGEIIELNNAMTGLTGLAGGRPVNVHSVINVATDMADDVHPNTNGSRKIADCFKTAINGGTCGSTPPPGGGGPPSNVPNSPVGSNVANNLNDPGARATMAKEYPGGTVGTILISIDEAMTEPDLQRIKNNIAEAHITIPILRLTGRKVGNAFAPISVADAQAAGKLIQQVFPAGTMVAVGNEVNSPTVEWLGGTPQSYGDALAAFANAAPNLTVLAAALDPFAEGTAQGKILAENFIAQVYGSNPGKFAGVDGVAFNSYQHYQASYDDVDCSSSAKPEIQRNTYCSWVWLKKLYAANGIKTDRSVLTEFNLIPFSDDGDHSKVIAFVDATKAKVLASGIQYITPLIRNACRAKQDTSMLEWIFFINRNPGPSRIVYPSNDADLSTNNCALIGDGGTGGECALPPTTGGGNPFSFLKSFFGGLTGLITGFIPVNGETVCETTKSQGGPDNIISANDVSPVSNSLPRFVGRIMDCNAPTTATVTIGASAYKDVPYSTDVLPFSVDSDLGHGLEAFIGETVQDYAVSQMTNGDTEHFKETILGYYMGNRGLPGVQNEIMDRAEAGDFKRSDDFPNTQYAYFNSGPLDKLLPYLGVSCNKGKPVKKRLDAEADCTMAGVMNAYACYYEGRNCEYSKLKNYDAIVAWAVPANVAGVQSDGQVLADNSSIPTWYTVTQQAKSRPVTISEFACDNENYETDDLGRDIIDRICFDLYGESFGKTGKIDEKSKFGILNAKKYGPENAKLTTPADDAKYGVKPMFRLIPRLPIKDALMKVNEQVVLEDGDKGKGSPFDRLREKQVAVPGVVAVAAAGEKLRQVFNPYNAPVKEVPPVSNQCGNRDAVAGKVPDPISGAKMGTENLSILARIGSGLTKKLKELFTGSKNEKRNATVTLQLTQPFTDIYKKISGPTGWTANFATFDMRKQLATKVGGTTIDAAGMKGKINCKDDLHCDSDAKIPFLGAGIITSDPDGLIPTLVTGVYDPNSKKVNSGRILKEMAERFSAPEPVALTVWGNLASFQTPENTTSEISQK